MELTKQDIDVIINMLKDMNDMCVLRPEELELKEKLERWATEND